MTRRQLLASLAAVPTSAQSPQHAPNLVFILADDLGYGDLSCYGQRMFETPNIDSLAAAGTRFTSAYAGSTVCAPSRCALMTGLHTGHTRIRGNGKNETVLRATDTVLPELLKPAGYTTGIFGKWALGGLGYPGYPTRKGFDEWFGFFSQGHAHNYYPELLLHNDAHVELKGNTGTRRSDYAPDVIHKAALDWLDTQSTGKPFFLYYNSTIPHTNNEMGRDTGNGQEVPSDAPFSSKQWPQVEKNFAAMVTRLDAHVGSLINQLKQKNLYDNTLVVFTSDNGAHKEGGHDARFFQSSGPLRGTKRDLYEGGIRVPAISTWANRIPAGKVSNLPWAFWDVLPTFCHAAGVTPPPGIDGATQLASWQGQTQPDHAPLYWEFHEGGFAQAIRSDRWKCIKLKSGAMELYDLSADLGETRNMASQNSQLIEQFRALMRRSRTDNPDWPVPANALA